ncbi:hypothetical protein HKD37_19G052923 [Glycine soja]
MVLPTMMSPNRVSEDRGTPPQHFRHTPFQIIHIVANFMRIWSIYSMYRYFLQTGASVVLFLFACLAPASILFLILQKPWKGRPLSNAQVVPSIINGGITALYLVLWGKGLKSCGPVRAILAEYSGAVLGVLSAVLYGRRGHLWKKCCILNWNIPWEDRDDSEVKTEPVLGLRKMLVPIIAGILSALRRVIARRVSIKVNQLKRRLHALTIASATCFMFPIAMWDMIIGSSSESDSNTKLPFSAWAFLSTILFGNIVIFYADSIAEERLHMVFSSPRHLAAAGACIIIMEKVYKMDFSLTGFTICCLILGFEASMDNVKAVKAILRSYEMLWDTKIPPRALTFAWRLLWDRLPTKENLSKRNVDLVNELCPFCQTSSESASHLLFSCHKVMPLWWEFNTWVKEDRALHCRPMEHFLQQYSIAGLKASNTRRKIWWIAATMSLWKLRNDVIFHNQPFQISKLVDNTNFLTWSWLRGWEKDFNAPFHQWSSTMPMAFIYHFQSAANVFLLFILKCLPKKYLFCRSVSSPSCSRKRLHCRIRFLPRAEMSTSSSSQAKEQDDDTKPIWTYITKIKSVAGGGNYEIKCNICDFTFNGSYTRVRAHLLKMTGKGVRVCQKVTVAKLIDLKKIDNKATLRVERSKTKSVSLPPVSTQHQMDTNTLGVDPKKRKTSSVENAFNLQARETLDHEIARMFYSSGLPFHLARNPHYRKTFAYAANNQISGYQPSGYNKLRTTLLQNERRHVENLLQPIKNAWSQKGVSIVSDGWSDPQRRSLINFMVVTESGPMFLKAIDCSNEIKDKDFIAKHMREVIMEVGHSNVVQIVIDNATVCKAAGLIIEAEFPSIYWTPCVPRIQKKNNVAYEECSWITQIADDAMFVKIFIMSHSMRLSIFNSLKLLSIAPTRFASTIVMLKRFKQLKKGLQEMVISDQWSSYKEDDVAKAKFVKDTLLDDKWWDKVDYILSFTSPIYDVLRRTDTKVSSLHLVYEMWDSMIEKVKNAIYQYERKEESEGSTFYEVVHSILIDRWTKSSTPLHCLAHSLNPRYYSHEWLSEDSNRVPPHQDMELTRERLKCFKRFFLDVDVRRKVNIEFANFSDGREGFDDLDSLNDRGQMDPKAWWLVHDINAPILQKIALKLLAQPCSSSCCERNWSTYSFIHSLKRNKMTPHRAEDLVFVHSNLRLLSRNTPQYHQEETKMWDVAGDDFGSLDDCGILEIASLSLDEPELEGVFFNDDC